MKQKAASPFILRLNELPDVEKTSSPSQERLPSTDRALPSSEIMPLLETILQRIESISAEQTAQRDLLCRLVPRMDADDRAVLSVLLPAVAARLGSSPFTAREIAHDVGFSALIEHRSARKLGRLLARNRDVEIKAGIKAFVVVRVTTERNAILWQVFESLGSA